ncbi:uncharacterized protein LOC107217324 [Neodiprion lecontei]|uniref:Uncharacterized protein LOC107217324 n=1 Tax=Neodiprion lecontei TaxID=441921 RepID=A0A6J0B7Y5_NEOLC|nr:uncharacterized protein LOC107217324 [Neodiprion lecontei]
MAAESYTERIQLENLLENGSNRVKWYNLEEAFKCRIQTGMIVNFKHVDTKAFMEESQTLFEKQIESALKKKNALKVNTVLTAKYFDSKNDEKILEDKYFSTKNSEILRTTDLKDWFLRNVVDPTLKKMEEFEELGSGWAFSSIDNLRININKYNPMRVGSHIKLPSAIKNKTACVNVRNKDNECFKWAVLSALHPCPNAQRVSNYKKYERELNFDGIEFPVLPIKIPDFEKQNDISINLFDLQKKNGKFTVHLHHKTTLKKEKHVTLLMIQNYYFDEGSEVEQDGKSDEEVEIRYHYVWVKNLSRLIHGVSKEKIKKHICDRCLCYFRKKEKLIQHELDCENLNEGKVVLPKPGNNTLMFKNFKNKYKVPFIVYADFECLLKPVPQVQSTSKTKLIHNHEPFDVGFYFKCNYDDKLSFYRSYRNSDHQDSKPAEWFVKQLEQLVEDIELVFWDPKRINELTADQKAEFNNSSTCHICEREILWEEKVKDHCHLTGNYLGPAHKDCNLKRQDSRAVPIVFHNLSGYDAHFLIKDISRGFEGRISLLPLTKERYISFTKYIKGRDKINLRFIDSFRFMNLSLEELASNLQELKIVKSEFSPITDEKLKLLTRKGVFPYEYLDALEKLDESKLPPKGKFYSVLNSSDVSDKDYKHAETVWKEFGIQTLGKYSDLYLKTDVLLLADVFENFRHSCLEAYGLDPAHYYTAPGLTWDAMLKYTKIELPLMTDIDMVTFIEKGIRGGVSQCSNRYAKANNKYMPDYNPDEDSKYLMYYDINNLYGWAMMQPLPEGGFEWVSNPSDLNFQNVADDSSVGYILEVDLEYPEAIHDKHRDLPLCPEHREPPGSKQSKLLTTLYDKTRYILHYRNLQQALRNGLRLTNIHRVLKFDQSPWLRKYIELNSEKRMNARNKFEEEFYKLMNNAIAGKTMENVRKRVDVKLVTKWKGRYGAEALFAKPNFRSVSVFDDNLVAVELGRMEILLDKPIYVGFCVLDLSKTHLYDFHYDYMISQFADRCKLLYTDTDSLIYEVQCPDIYEIMKRDIHKFDTSNYDSQNRYGIKQENKKVVGLMKDECEGKLLREFVGLRSKMYCLRIENEPDKKKAKGVTKPVVENNVKFEHYLECLNEMKTRRFKQHTFRSNFHAVNTVEQDKLALNPDDDKRQLLPDTTDTLPWGYRKTPRSVDMDTD